MLEHPAATTKAPIAVASRKHHCAPALIATSVSLRSLANRLGAIVGRGQAICLAALSGADKQGDR